MTAPLPSHPHHPAAPPPHVMVSRINPRLSSFAGGAADSKDAVFDTSSSFAQDESTTDQSWSVSTNESFGNAVCVQSSTSSSVSSSLSYNGRWCEEEKTMPLKKRRVLMVSYETSQRKEMKKNKKDAGEKKQEIGEIEGYESCNLKDGKGWKCRKMRVKGHSYCKHHLEKQRMNDINRRKQNKKHKEVKARSISSLLKNTVPLLG
ncbi:Growth-regulating factor 5 [Corchorus olitorius]|uniref:Growth-regulating factor 5 n=1 Tax=Corchorus olitorius TaxID=93759 RepID=A0A1R3HEZ0_9ROSI|nr:Growth-regulating factor 5 [Corchorus olitorius]